MALRQQRMVINISGQTFETTAETLSRCPETRLGKLVDDDRAVSASYFFPQDSDVFREILNFYQTGDLHCPKNICLSSFLTQLEFWEISPSLISECCSQQLRDEEDIQHQFGFFDRRVSHSITELNRLTNFRYQLWCFLTDPFGPNTRFSCASKLWTIFYLMMTFINALCYSLETLPAMWASSSTEEESSYNTTSTTQGHIKLIRSCEEYLANHQMNELKILAYIDVGLTCFFAIEIWIRFFCCPDKRYFWRTINGLDMVISNAECVASALFFYLNHYLLLQSEMAASHHAYCSASSYIDITALVIGQVRLFRLLSYASIYRYLKINCSSKIS